MTGRMEGKVVLITGAARGQGRSHAERLAAEGADVIAIDSCEDNPSAPHSGGTEEELDETVALVERLGRRIYAAKVDVRDVGALRGAVDAGVGALGRLDAVAANAGISTSPFLSAEMPERTWQDVIDINLTGVWHTTSVAIPHLLKGGRGGSIAIISSAAGLKGYANVGNYVAAKHGLVGLMKTLAIELAPHSIRVNTIHPTQVDTPMIQNSATYRLFAPDAQDPSAADMAPVSQSMNALPVPWVESIDVSNALLFLVSDEARYITGTALPVDAGCLL